MFQNTMNENDKKILFTRFNDCRQKFVLSLNSITVLSLFVLLTTFIPYTTYVGNLMDLRKTEETELTKQEQQGNFDLIGLEQKWMRKHAPSSIDAEGKVLNRNSQFRTPLGSFNISNAELVIIYPAVLSALIVYLFCNMYNLYDLKRELKDNYENTKILQIPNARILLCGLLLYSSFFWSVRALGEEKDFSDKTSETSFRSEETVVEEEKDVPHETSFRLGEIVVQEAHFQITRDLDQWIVLPSALAVVLAPFIYSAFYWKLFSYISSRSLKTGKAVSEG